MKYLLLEGFPKGLDARKLNLSAPAGTLVELNNGHITNGGEIEKRKAFVLYGNVAITETGATATAGIRTFGIQKTASGLTVFGSALAFGSGASLSQPILTAAMPAGVTYQQLKHVAVVDGETYVAATHAMTAVKSSTSFGGAIYALATFADGSTFGYYDGVIDRSYSDGLIMAHLNTNTKIATAIKEMVNRSADYTATNPSATVAQVTGPVGLVFDAAALDDSAGTLAAAKVSDPTPAYAARQAIGSFQIIAGSSSAGTNKITKVEVGPSGGALVTITNAAVDWTNSNEFTATLLAQSINAKASTPEYTAEASGNTVTILALQADGDASNNYVVVTTAGGNVCVGNVQFQFIATTGYSINALYIAGTDRLTGGAIAWAAAGSTTNGMASAVAADINTNTGTHGYVACATGSIISISKAVTRSDDPLIPIYFVGATFATGNGVFEVGTGSGSVSSLSALLLHASGPTASSGYYYYYYTLTIQGGVTPYLAPVWGGGYAVTKVDALTYRVAFTPVGGRFPPPPPPVLHIYCDVTDSSGVTVRSNTT